MNKGVFFKKVNTNDIVSEDKNQIKESKDSNTDKSKDSIILDRNITEYVIDNFTDISLDIRDSLINFADTLENTIDYIEDRSSELIKNSRNFQLSKEYRDKSMEIYEVVRKINDYVSWIDKDYEITKNKNKVDDFDKEAKEDIKADEEIEEDNKLCIYEDFTQKSPKAFKIDEYYSEVSDWKELTVKAADILTKKYKNNNEYKEISVDDVVLKESIENDFRDSVIDILKIYSVPLNKFYVYIN